MFTEPVVLSVDDVAFLYWDVACDVLVRLMGHSDAVMPQISTCCSVEPAKQITT